jgi:DNA segregation ATPase FtsK/SpoIIIE-like protein
VITAATPLTIVVTTTETGKTTAVRTFTVAVTAAPYATAPTVALTAGDATAPTVATDVALPLPGATDTTGAVTGWITATNETIKFTVTPGAAGESTITINDGAYISGADYVITAATPLTIVVTTTETGKTTAVRTFTVAVTAAPEE